MFLLPNKIYNKLRVGEIGKARTILKRIRIETIFNNLTRSCWRHGLQYVTLVKNDEILIIKLYGHKECILLKFHKTEMVFIEDYERFLTLVNNNGAIRGIYITTGAFHERVLSRRKNSSTYTKDIRIEDGFHFIRRHIGLWGRAGDVLNNGNVSFLRYLPS